MNNLLFRTHEFANDEIEFHYHQSLGEALLYADSNQGVYEIRFTSMAGESVMLARTIDGEWVIDNVEKLMHDEEERKHAGLSG